MRTETYSRQSDGTTKLVEITELLQVEGVARYHRENPPGTVKEDRLADANERQVLADEEGKTKREVARARAVAAILANKSGAPWGAILYDLAVAQGLIEPA